MDPREALEKLHEQPWGTIVGNKMIVRHYSKDRGGWGKSALVPYSKLPMDPLASCLHYGASVFEGLKAFRVLPTGTGSTSSASTDVESPVVLFRPELNAERLRQSAARQALPEVPVADFVHDVKRLVSSLAEYVPEERGSSLYVRVVLFATQAALGVKRSSEALLLVLGLPVPRYYTGAVRLLAESRFVRSWPGGCGYAKAAGNYALTVKPAEDAASKGYHQILWLFQGKVTESGVMNFFAVFRSHQEGKYVLVTPPIDSGLILPGITRRSLIEIARSELKDFVQVREEEIGIRTLCESIDTGHIVDVFGCGTAALLTPVESVTMSDDYIEHKVKREPLFNKMCFSDLLRERLLDIQHSLNHPWTTVAWNTSNTQKSCETDKEFLDDTTLLEA